MQVKYAKTAELDIAYHEYGDTSGWACILAHGFPYDALAYAEAAALLSKEGARVFVPYLRGFGRTRFRSSTTPRSGEQAALGHDLLSFMDALEIPKAVLAGYDWGGRAACVVSALWPERVEALVSGGSYQIQDIARSTQPVSAEQEATFWYQYYFHSERGSRGLEQNRREIARLLWKMWSPTWVVADDVFNQTAASFDNPDFVAVSLHSYRHRFGLVNGDPSYQHIEARLSSLPAISVPSITIDGQNDGVSSSTSHHAKYFTGPYEHRIFPGAGHNLPQERPGDWAKAVFDAHQIALQSTASMKS